MKRREFLKRAGLGAVAAGGVAAPAIAQSSPEVRWRLSPEEVALYTVRALEKNRAIIIPGRRNRWFAFLPRLGSRWLNRTIIGMVNKAYCPR